MTKAEKRKLAELSLIYGVPIVTQAREFCLDMLEKSPFTYNPRIMETLLQIAEHLETGKELSYENIQAGTVIADSWQKIYA